METSIILEFGIILFCLLAGARYGGYGLGLISGIGLLIFDYKSDYVDDAFSEANQSKRLRLYRLPYNPLSLYGDMPMLPVHTATGFAETLAKAFGLGPKQQLRLRKLILDAFSPQKPRQGCGRVPVDSGQGHLAKPLVNLLERAHHVQHFAGHLPPPIDVLEVPDVVLDAVANSQVVEEPPCLNP